MSRSGFAVFGVWMFLAMGLGRSAEASQAPVERAANPAPLWGDLKPGRYGVGYKVLYRFDPTRTWAATRPYGKPFSADLNGRPMRISVWYPAASASGKKMVHGDYFTGGTAPKGFEDIEAQVLQRDGGALRQNFPATFSAMAATPVNASRNAPAAPGRFPIVLTTGGQAAMLTTNSTLAEYLASHGYVVATVFTLGPTSEETSLGLSPAEVSITVRDFQFTTSVVRALPNVDASRLAMVGHSLGGSTAVLFAMQHANVSAVVGLDGTYGFPNPPAVPGIRSVTEGYHYAPRQMQAALLDLRRKQPFIDLTAVHAFRHSDRYLLTLDNATHSTFTTGALHQRFHEPFPQNSSNATRESSGEGFRWSCQVIEAFLDLQLQKDPTGLTRMKEAVASNPRTAMTQEPALPIRPPPSVLLEQAERLGLDTVIAQVEQYRREIPEEPVVEESVFNVLGYELVGQGKPERAVLAFRLVAYFNPASANAADSLGDGYSAAGQKELARKAYERSVQLAPTDTALDEQSRTNLLDESRKKLQALTP